MKEKSIAVLQARESNGNMLKWKKLVSRSAVDGSREEFAASYQSGQSY